MKQSYRSIVVLVKPTAFFANPITMLDNHFQHSSEGDQAEAESAAAQREHTEVGRELARRGVNVSLVPSAFDGKMHRPDAIFPNNSLSFHVTARAAAPPLLTAFLYPMSPGRREEVPLPLLHALTKLSTEHAADFKLVDLRGLQDPAAVASAGLSSPEQHGGLVLEGTGALVFSHDATALYVGKSQRAHSNLLQRISATPESEAFHAPTLREVHLFAAADRSGRLVYHTNVVGWCGVRVAAWCFAAMTFDDAEPITTATGTTFFSSRAAMEDSFASRGVKLLKLSFDEMDSFAGNALELFDGAGRPTLTISAVAWAALSPENKAAVVEAYGGEDHVAPLSIPTIERLGGGSVRCLQCHLNYTVDEHGVAAAPAVDLLLAELAKLNAL